MAENKEKHLPTASDWDKVRPLYLRGEELEAIVKAFPDVQFSKESILKRMKAEGLTDKKKQIDSNVNAELSAIAEAEKIKFTKKCKSLYEDMFVSLSEIGKDFKNQTKGNKSKIGLKLTTYNFDLYASAVKKFQEGQRVNLGMDKDGKLQNKQPEVLVIQGVDTDKI